MDDKIKKATIDPDDIRSRLYRQLSPAAYAYANWKGWIVEQIVLCSIDNGQLAFSFHVTENGTRWYHVYLPVVERWAEENQITIPPLEKRSRPQ